MRYLSTPTFVGVVLAREEIRSWAIFFGKRNLIGQTRVKQIQQWICHAVYEKSDRLVPFTAPVIQTLGEESAVNDRGYSPNVFNGEFDSGSERTLAAWIRHASRTRFFAVAIQWNV